MNEFASAAAPGLEFVFRLCIDLAAAQEFGETSAGGERRVVPIVGGHFEGPALGGEVLNVGADWQVVSADGTASLDARYTLKTESGALVYVSNHGLRTGSPEVLARLRAGEVVDPASYYFRTVPRFETSAAELQWLSRSLFLCTGERRRDQVLLNCWRVL